MDQSSTRTKRTSVGYLGKGRLMGGRGVIFPGSYRGGDKSSQDKDIRLAKDLARNL
jgi:hypothetical protein